MKRKGHKKNYPDEDYIDRKQKRNYEKKDRSSKRKLTIYDDFEDEDLDDYASSYDDFYEDDDF